MTRIIAVIAAALMAVLGLNTTTTIDQAETTQEVVELLELVGTVEEMDDAYIIINTTEGQRIQVNLGADTAYDGEPPALGDLIHVLYDGKMTRSIPPQVTAQHIGCYYHVGAIVELTQEGFTLDVGEQMLEVHAEQSLVDGLENGQQVKVYTNGIMTMSLPAQVNAQLVVPVE